MKPWIEVLETGCVHSQVIRDRGFEDCPNGEAPFAGIGFDASSDIFREGVEEGVCGLFGKVPFQLLLGKLGHGSILHSYLRIIARSDFLENQHFQFFCL